jgi:hypothetical protein
MGDVVGPASSVDNSIARFDGTTGKLVQDGDLWRIEDDGTLASYNVSGTDYEKFGIDWASNLLSFTTSKGGTGTNRDIEFNVGGSKLHLKTDGSIYLDVAGQTVGNARGGGALDLQVARNSAAQVASGGGAAAIGAYNISSGSNSVSIGYNNTSSGVYTVAIGSGAKATTGQTAIAIGQNAEATGKYAISIGLYTLAANAGQIAFGYSIGPGLGHGNLQTLFKTTTDATQTILDISGTATDRVVIPAKRACTITGLITAYSDSTDGYKAASWEIKCLIERNASNVTRIIGTPIIDQLFADDDAISGAWDVVSVTADDTNESLAITVQGEVGTNIRWQGSLFYGQVGHA